MAESKHRIYTSALEAALGAQLESGSKQPIRLDACGIAARQGLAHGPGRGGRCHDHRRARVGGYAWRGWRHTRVCAAKKGERERRREAHATDGVLNFLRLPERATQADDAVGERLAARAHCRSEEVVRIITRSAPESIRMRYLVGLWACRRAHVGSVSKGGTHARVRQRTFCSFSIAEAMRAAVGSPYSSCMMA
eukprot:scaffold36690_cov30-Tisochrysis_lutea.AAC.2